MARSEISQTAIPAPPPASFSYHCGLVNRTHSPQSLLSLPADILRRILFFVDLPTLRHLSTLNSALYDEICDDSLWKLLAIRRFRVTARTPNSRRLQADRPLSWRLLYSNWHISARMPVSRVSGPNFAAFARGRASGVFAWLTVSSADDCRVSHGILRVRVVVQNVSAGTAHLRDGGIVFQLGGAGLVGAGAKYPVKGCHASVVSAVVETARDGASHSVSCPPAGGLPLPLHKDDFAVLSVEVCVAGAVFEVDALERVDRLTVTVDLDGECGRANVECPLSQKQIWESYELLPGGWWARLG